MFTRYLAPVTVFVLLSACSSNGDDDSHQTGGTGGVAPTAGAGGSAAAGIGGTSASGGSGATTGGAGTGGSAQGGAGAGGTAGTGAGTAGAAAGMSGAAGAAGGAPTGGCIVPMNADDEPKQLSQTGCVDPSDPTKAAAALVPYEVNSALWSDGAAKERYLFVPAGQKIHVRDCEAQPDTCMAPDAGGDGADDGHWDLPIGSVAMKVFLLDGKRVETRLLMRRTESTWRGYSFEWNDAGTDATLLIEGKDKPIGSQTWHYPSPSDCLTCHTKAGGRSLGPTTAQLNRDHAYADGTMNQIDKFEALGLLEGMPTRIAGYPDPKGTADIELRARSYLQANCAICHRPGGPVSDVDLRFTTSFKDTKLCNEMVVNGTGDAMLPQIRLTPGDPSKSSLSFRMHTTTTYRMPKIGSNVVDPDGTALVDQWITSITTCP